MKEKSPKILVAIADDHYLARRGIRDMLKQVETIEVVQEYDSAKALLKDVNLIQWDVIVLDIELGDGNGVEVAEQILKHRPDTKILALSAFSASKYGFMALKSGASGFLNKDTSSADLIDAITRVFQGHKYLNQELTNIAVEQWIRPELRKNPHENLSIREFQVLCLLADGLGNKEIATQLNVSPKSISTYRMRVSEKLGLENSSDLIRYAIENNLKSGS